MGVRLRTWLHRDELDERLAARLRTPRNPHRGGTRWGQQRRAAIALDALNADPAMATAR